MADEETPLNSGAPAVSDASGSDAPPEASTTKSFNLERIRLIGLLGVVALLVTGNTVSEYAVVFPDKPDPSSVWDKLFHGAPSDFVREESFIFKMFGFNHTCSVLDFNPSKTISALVIQLSIMPLCLFTIGHYLRVSSQTGTCFKNIQRFSKIASPIQFLANTYFYMVFVNSPDGVWGTPEGMRKYTLHYFPYMCWQFGLVLMAIQQCWYISLKDQIPFSWVTKELLWNYVLFLMAMFCVYTYFCWSFINGRPAWDTFSEPGQSIAKLLMWLWNVIAIFIPAIFAYFESSDGIDDDFEITFTLKSKVTN